MIIEREKVLRQRLIATFDKPTLKSFYELRRGRVVWTFTHIWLGLAAALAAGYWAWRAEVLWPKILIPVLVFYIGTRLNALAVQVHEAAHNLLFAGRWLNDTFCNLLGAYWVLNDVESYRRVHLVHHTDLHLDSDPDRDLYELSATAGRFQITKLILQDIFWITALRRIVSYLCAEKQGGNRGGGIIHAAFKAGAQCLLIALAILSLGWPQGLFFYLVFWLVPLFSIFPAIIRLRIVTEHFSPTLFYPDGRPFISRTTCTHPLEIYLFGCDMEHHFEHHLLPAIPHPQLARLHAALIAKGFFETLPSDEDFLSAGYLRFWARLLRGSLPRGAPRPVHSA